MEWRIVHLTPELSDDYFDFFDNRAFTDGSPYRCYCQLYQMSKSQQEEALRSQPDSSNGTLWRSIAERQIKEGALRGYLAYDNGKAVGWCNANDRANYPAEPCCDVLFHSPVPKQEIAVTCFEIAPDFRGRGMATALLKQVIADAQARHYASVVGFPVARSERFEWDCTGPVRLYEKLGFRKVAEHGDTIVIKKDL